VLTATSWEGEAYSSGGFGALAGLSVEGGVFKRLTATLQAGYRGSRDGQFIEPLPGASLLMGWRIPVIGPISLTPLGGCTVDLLCTEYPPLPIANLTASVRFSFLLHGRDYLTLTPSLSIPFGQDRDVRFALAFGTRRETAWLMPVPVVNPGVNATPILFSPDNDGHDDEVTITFSADASESIRDWTLVAILKDGSAWREFHGTGALPESIIWDGKSSDGLACDAGDEFALALETRDLLGRVSSSVTSVKVTVDILVLRDGDRYKVRVPDIYFPANSYRLDDSQSFLDDNYAVLVRLASLFARFPEYSLVIEGYANSVFWQDTASFEAEQTAELIPLSRKRAETVAQALVLLGIDERRIRTVGYGASRPLVEFRDKTGIWKNRRVEFILER
jgi:outer membrane protein OmpA-like peptidoglycan-associated protein